MELLRVTKSFLLSHYLVFTKVQKTGCMNAPSEHQNNLDLLFIDLGKRAMSIQNEYSIEKIVNIVM